ncbi:MAG: ferrous iron transport protein B [Sedimentisphaerales bacterium]|nr:ferrous iron transport protein B [Sedimentisphaerales bacterium]
MKHITAALAGNPNSGKTTVFNMLTGSHQHVANYPGVTVEIKEGKCIYKDYEIKFIDLPGTYSLSAYSEEELLARNFIMDEQPDVVVHVVDSSNIERNLYIATQLLEMNVPLVLNFNMADIAEQKGMVFDIKQFSTLLKTPIVQTVGRKEKGKIELLNAILNVVESQKADTAKLINYGSEIEEEIAKIESLIDKQKYSLVKKYGTRWLTIKLLEKDDEITKAIRNEEITNAVAESIGHIETIFKDTPETVMADRRYGFISGACTETIKSTVELRHNISDVIDSLVIHKVLGLPIFLLLMYIVFMLTFRLGEYPMKGLESFFGWSSSAINSAWPDTSMLWLKSLIIDGVIAGVGGIIVFLPNILLLFLAIAFLEDTGYIARAAFVMDRLMHKMGLHGKSFIPMLIGFGCSIPAIMATRILENRRNRLTTIMIIPLMSCGAKLTIYMLIIPAFFPQHLQGPMLWIIYVIGIALAVICARLLRNTLFKGETIPFVMELPPYRMPTAKAVLIHMWQRAWLYLKKAGTIILAISIILWILSSYPKVDEKSLEGLTTEQTQQAELEYSVIGRFGKAIEPALKPLGFDWKIGTALIGATAAKEVFVTQLGIVYAVGQADETSQTLRDKLREHYSSLTGFCIMLFCLIYAPCVATLAATRMETRSWRWPLFQFAYLTMLAYILTLFVYQIGRLFM